MILADAQHLYQRSCSSGVSSYDEVESKIRTLLCEPALDVEGIAYDGRCLCSTKVRMARRPGIPMEDTSPCVEKLPQGRLTGVSKFILETPSGSLAERDSRVRGWTPGGTYHSGGPSGFRRRLMPNTTQIGCQAVSSLSFWAEAATG